MAAARSSTDDNAMRYVLPVLWMTSCLPIIGEARTALVTGVYSKLLTGGQEVFGPPLPLVGLYGVCSNYFYS